MSVAAIGARPDQEGTTSQRVSSSMCAAAIVLGSLTSVLLRWMVPLSPLSNAVDPYDAGLVQRDAVALSNHTWLGPFDKLTLSKGPGFPAFVVASHKLGIPLQVATQLTYLLAAGFLALSLWLITRRLIAATFVYLILAFDPVNFTALSSRIGRDNWYAAVSLLFLSAVFVVAYLVIHRARLRWTLPTAAFAGLSGAAFWLCREEGIWIVPSILLILVGLSAARFASRSREEVRTRPGQRERFVRWGSVAAVFAIAAAALCAPIVYVGWKNERTYGVNVISDLASGAFSQAYGAWSRVRGVPLEDYVPIDRAQREAVYAVSPAARELQPVLEDPANAWRTFGCDSVKVCDDFAGGWAPWAIRDAALATGHFNSEPEFQAYFLDLAAQINAACDDGRLECTPNLPVVIQPLLRASVLPTVQSALRWLADLPGDPSYYSDFGPEQTFPITDEERAALQGAVTGVPSTDVEAFSLAASYQSKQWIYVWLGSVFEISFLVLLGMALAGLLLGWVWRRDRPRNLAVWTLTSALSVAVVTRLVLLAVLDTTQYAIVAQYHYVTRTLLLSLAAIGAANLVHVVRSHIAVRRHPAGGQASTPLVAIDARRAGHPPDHTANLT